jgi:hypothetical protein
MYMIFMTDHLSTETQVSEQEYNNCTVKDDYIKKYFEILHMYTIYTVYHNKENIYIAFEPSFTLLLLHVQQDDAFYTELLNSVDSSFNILASSPHTWCSSPHHLRSQSSYSFLPLDSCRQSPPGRACCRDVRLHTSCCSGQWAKMPWPPERWGSNRHAECWIELRTYWRSKGYLYLYWWINCDDKTLFFSLCATDWVSVWVCELARVFFFLFSIFSFL